MTSTGMDALIEDTCVIVPCFNEGKSIAGVIEAIRTSLPGATVVVVDDGSSDDSAARALDAGAQVLRLPFNLGIGGAVQTGYLFAMEGGFEVAVQVDGDGQHRPSEITRLLEPILADEADLVIGSRWLGRGDYDSTTSRRVGMRVLARVVRHHTDQLVTDTTSGFRAVGRKTLPIFARTYPADFPEAESIIMAHVAGLRVTEVPVAMSERVHGKSSIAGLRSAYLMVRVLSSMFVDNFGLRSR